VAVMLLSGCDQYMTAKDMEEEAVEAPKYEV
jgi:hypothetical protein